MKNPNKKLLRESSFVSFDGSTTITTLHQRLDRYRHISMEFNSFKRICRGSGLSFSPVSFSKNTIVQEMTLFNRFLSFDEARKLVKVEAGMALSKLLLWSSEKGLNFPIIPGHPRITIGGAVAADVHGKNPMKDGTILNWIVGITLYHPVRGYLKLSKNENSDIFKLTVGGFGLTGTIVDVTLQLKKMNGNSYIHKSRKISSFDEALQLIDKESQSCEYIYSWHGNMGSSSLGKGVVFSGNWDEKNVQEKEKKLGVTASQRSFLPFSLWNALTVKIANNIFYSASRGEKYISQYRANFPFAYNALYHTLYGKKGFVELQFMLTNDNALQFIYEIKDLLCQKKSPLVMIAIKGFSGDSKSLSPAGSGYMIAINLYHSKFLEYYVDTLYQIAMHFNAQLNLSKNLPELKNASLSLLHHYQYFKDHLLEFDPDKYCSSELRSRFSL